MSDNNASLAKRFVLQTTMLATDFAFLTSFVSELFLTATMAHKMTKKSKINITVIDIKMHRLFLIFVVGYGAMCSQRVINSTLTFAINNPMTLPG
jgi:hypothetical protein